jgi:hypothetical protein
MLYKVTPALAPVGRGPAPARDGTHPKKRRASAVFDGEGHEVLITLMCLKCRNMKPLGQFGLRRMPDGAIRNQPWCRGCRGAVTPKKKPQGVAEALSATELSGLGASEAASPAPLGLSSLADGPREAPAMASPHASETDSLEGWAGVGRE